ncbi:MAG: hypothetical protein ACOX1Q_04235 [Eubacteriales bacterium]
MVKAVKMDNKELTAIPEGIRKRPHYAARGYDGGGQRSQARGNGGYER